MPFLAFTLLNFTFMTGYWDAVSRPLFEKQPALISLFIIFVAFSNLGLFNVILLAHNIKKWFFYLQKQF